MMIQGQGLFRVKTCPDVGGGLAYTRSGNFIKNRDGNLVLANSDGYLLDPPIVIPQEATQVQIQTDGVVQVMLPGQTQPQNVGQVQLYRFANEAGLADAGSNLLTQTEASGQAIEAQPSTNGMGEIRAGYLEASNVDAVTELVSLIKTQRAFELNSQVITAGNEMLQTVTHLR
jgi:flagellar basal-body rod protein FlgG